MVDVRSQFWRMKVEGRFDRISSKGVLRRKATRGRQSTISKSVDLVQLEWIRNQYPRVARGCVEGAAAALVATALAHMVIACRDPCTMALRPTYYVYIDLEVYIFRSIPHPLNPPPPWVSVSQPAGRVCASYLSRFGCHFDGKGGGGWGKVCSLWRVNYYS